MFMHQLQFKPKMLLFTAEDEQYFPDDDGEGKGLLDWGEKSRSKSPRSSGIKKTVPYLIWMLLASTFTAMVTYWLCHTRHLNRSPNMHSPCGSSPSEARAAGCTFDIVSFNWLPDRCYDAELSEVFEKQLEWEWFLDVNQTLPVSKAEVATGEHPVLYVTWNYHITHCTYMWKKMHRSIIKGQLNSIDMYIGNYNHTEHCSHMLLSRRNVSLSTINTGIRVKYPDCGMDFGWASKARLRS